MRPLLFLPLLALVAAAPPAAEPPADTPPAVEPAAAPIRLDQLGFEPLGRKLAVVPLTDAAARDWTLRDAAGRIVASGRTLAFGPDAASGETLQRIDFSRFRGQGDGFVLAVGDRRSHAFAIHPHRFRRLATDAMSFFYQQRSAVPILAAYVQRPDLARAAGHPREVVTCFAGKDERGADWPGCSYSLDVTGGWYDAGDHGKYVVNGGISAWTLLDLHQRLGPWGAGQAFADGRLALPERGNGGDDLLDEARVEVEFLLRMQVPDGQRLTVAMRTGGGRPASDFRRIDAGGMAHSKVADIAWTGLPTAPADDPMARRLYPPTTGATLNLAAVSAQAARAWKSSDPAFAARARAAALRAWAAAERNPAILASSDFAGSGGYGDPDLSDERFWAAAELLATTGDPRFAAIVAASPYLDRPSGDLSWGRLDQAGLMTLATSGDPVPTSIRDRARTAIRTLAAGYQAERARSGYALPFAGTAYQWGSNSTLLNRAMLLGVAWQIDRRPADREAAIDVVDYLLGRNPLDRSYVTGFGQRTMHQPHHRFWARAADPRYPAPPPGVVSGGPNSTAMSDPVASRMKGRCVGQTCWVDDWRAFTMNEVAINWNAPLVWVAAFLDATEA